MEANDLAILAGVGLVYAMVSRRLDRTIVTSAIVFLTAGIVLGDAVLGWFTVGPSGAILRLIAESTLALVLFTDASRGSTCAPCAASSRFRCACSPSGCR